MIVNTQWWDRSHVPQIWWTVTGTASLLWYFAQNTYLNLIMRKHQTKSCEWQKYKVTGLYSSKMLTSQKTKRLRNWFPLKETKRICQLKVVCDPELDSGMKKEMLRNDTIGSHLNMDCGSDNGIKSLLTAWLWKLHYGYTEKCSHSYEMHTEIFWG